MVIDLKPEQEEIINLAIESGTYRNSDEVLSRALEFIRAEIETDDWTLEERKAIAARIEHSRAQARRGELIDGDAVLEILHRRQAERRKTH